MEGDSGRCLCDTELHGERLGSDPRALKIVTMTSNSNKTVIVGISGGWFGRQWDGSMPLGDDALGLVVSSVNAGDWQNFSFSSPLLDGTVMYIENFDSSSIALMTFTGATGTTLVDASQSIAYAGIGEYGLMVTSN